MKLEDLPLIESARLGRRPNADSEVARAYQAKAPAVSAALGSLGVSLGLEGIKFLQDKVFPSGNQMAALQARGMAASYDTYSDCGPYSYGGDCDEPCFGFAPHHMDPFYCATCAEQAADPTNNPSWNWHFVGTRGSIEYKDMEPDACAGKDAWKWKVYGSCGSCNESSVYRCHDGYKKYPANNYWDPTICAGLIACDDQLNTCP